MFFTYSSSIFVKCSCEQLDPVYTLFLILKWKGIFSFLLFGVSCCGRNIGDLIFFFFFFHRVSLKKKKGVVSLNCQH